jgi:hypothetical protein
MIQPSQLSFNNSAVAKPLNGVSRRPSSRKQYWQGTVTALCVAFAGGALLTAPSTAQAAQSHRAKPCTAINPTVEPATVRLALNNKYSTTKGHETYQIVSVSERNNKGESGQCDFYVTLDSPHQAPIREMVWRFYPYSALSKKLPHPNLVLPGLYGIEKGNTIAGVIAGYGGFSATSAVGHATPSEAAELDALAIRWAVSHRVQNSSSSTTSST